MPTKNEKSGQLFCEIDINLRKEREIIIGQGERIDVSELEFMFDERIIITNKKWKYINNCRKMHHLPLIRSSGMRK